MPARCRAEPVVRRAAEAWDAAAASAAQPSLYRVLWKVCGCDLGIAIACGLLQGVISALLRPLILRGMVQALTQEEASPLPPAAWVSLLGLALLVECVCAANRAYFGVDIVGVSCVSALAGLVHRHSMLLPAGLRSTGTPVVNLIGTDAVRLQENQKGLMLLPFGASAVVAGIIALLLSLGPFGLIGLIPMLMMLCVNVYFAQRAKVAEHENLMLADERMDIMGQMVHGIKAVKLAAWEEKYMKLLGNARAKECVPLKQWRMFLQFTRQLGRANPIVASCVLFFSLALLNPDELAKPANVFAAANVFLALRLPFIALPEGMTYMATLRVTIQRFEAFLALPRAEKRPAVDPPPEPRPLAIDVHGATFAWPDAQGKEVVALKDLSLTVAGGEMVAIVGDVGSGKTTLLSALLGDLRQLGGECKVEPTVGWVPQRPFVLSGTIQRNVAMGRAGDIGAPLGAAALADDVARLGGIGAEVGERGVTLSGGQAQRLVIARAVMCAPCLLLADDPLSAVDTKSSSAIFATLSSLAHGGCTLVMAMNQLHLLPQFDKAVILRSDSAPLVVDLTDTAAALKELAAVDGEFGDALRRAVSGSYTAPPGSTEEEEEEPPQALKADASSPGLTSKDMQSTGQISGRVLKRYIHGMGVWYAAFCFFLAIATYSAMGFTDRWLAVWVTAAEEALANGETLSHARYAGIYVTGSAVFCVLLFWTSYAFAEGGVRSSRNIHHICLERMLHAPLSWFESMPSGRILSRFSSDVAMVDQAVAQWADNLLQLTCTLMLLIISVAIILPWCVVPFVAAIALFTRLLQDTQKAARDVRRWAIDCMSPVLTNLSEAYSGRQSLRSMQMAPLMEDMMFESLDAYNAFQLASMLPIDFGMLGSGVISVLVGCPTAVFCFMQRDEYEPSFMAFALTYSFLMPYFLAFYGDILNRFLISLTGLERLLHYAEIEQEPPWHVAGEPQLLGAAWPSKGALQFKDISLVYREGLAPCLSGVDFAVEGGRSVGIVGRSGAGKSSLFALLFRLREPTSGSILIDGVDIAQLGLQVLRRRLAILPQEPLLFPGTIRENLDPFFEHEDAKLQSALEAVGLRGLLEGRDEGAEVGVSHLAALSTGERQLLALARMMLRSAEETRVVLFDEPTSSVDAATDAKVQRVLRASFEGSTVLMVAHRLQTVLCSDVMLVLEKGRVVEQGPPEELLRDPSSHLAGLAREAGELQHDPVLRPTGKLTL